MSKSTEGSKDKRKKRIALIGCGRISERHLSALKASAHLVEVLGVCDVVRERAQKAAEFCIESALGDTIVFTSYSDLLHELKSRLDLVVLATPSGLHVSQAREAIEMGLSVLSEKPLSTLKSDTELLWNTLQSARQKGAHLFVIKQNRFNAPVQELKRSIDLGRFGHVHTFMSRVLWTRPDSYYQEAPWRGTRLMDGGAVLNQASHYVDLFSYLGGKIESVSAMGATQARKIECEDSAVIQFRFRSGALGSLVVSVLTYPRNLEGSFTVLGMNGTLAIGGTALNHIDKYEFSDGHSYDHSKLSYSTDSVYGFGHEPYYLGVFRSLDGEEVPEIAKNEQCFQTADLLDAIYASFDASGQTVLLPTRNGFTE